MAFNTARVQAPFRRRTEPPAFRRGWPQVLVVPRRSAPLALLGLPAKRTPLFALGAPPRPLPTTKTATRPSVSPRQPSRPRAPSSATGTARLGPSRARVAPATVFVAAEA